MAAGRSPVTVEPTPVKGDVLSAATDYLLTGSVRENNTFAGARNVLYFDVRANMFIQSGAEFVLMGLTGSGGCAATGAAVCTISLDGPFKVRFSTMTCFRAIQGLALGVFGNVVGGVALMRNVKTRDAAHS